MSRMRVAVIMGGASAEREVSLSSGRNVMAALDPARYQALPYDLRPLPGGRRLALEPMDPLTLEPATHSALCPSHTTQPGQPRSADIPSTALRAGLSALSHLRPPTPDPRSPTPDVAFLALHGGAGEDGTVQGLLELLDIPYTGSGVLASALAMNKVFSKKLLRQEGIPTPDFRSARGPDAAAAGACEAASALGFPLVVKPACEGSTVGISIVRSAGELSAALKLALS